MQPVSELHDRALGLTYSQCRPCRLCLGEGGREGGRERERERQRQRDRETERDLMHTLALQVDFLPPRQRAFVAARMGAGGKLAREAQACKFGLACRRSDCWFSHPEACAVVSERTGDDAGSGAGEEEGEEAAREEGDWWGELPLEHRRSGVVELLLHGRSPYTSSV